MRWRQLVEPTTPRACLWTAALWVAGGVALYLRDGMSGTLLIPALMVGALLERAQS